MTMGDIQFLVWQWLLLIPICWTVLIWWYHKPRSQQTASIADADLSAYNQFYHPLTDILLTAQQTSGARAKQKRFWQKIDFWVYGLVFSGLIAALAQPILLGKRLPDPPAERDIVFLVDTSVSMQLKDYMLAGEPVTRMQLLRNLLDEFAKQMQGEKISVILFAERPYILVPLSSDQHLIRRMLGRITTTLAGRYTSIGNALLMALNEANKQQHRHQTFILFTDADTSRGEISATAAAEVVGEHGIPIFTIGIGSSQKQEDQEIAGGLYQALDLALLDDIAKRSNGKSYHVNNTEAMQQALQEILQQRKNDAVPKAQYQHHMMYFYPLGFALLVLVLWQIYRLMRQVQNQAITTKSQNKNTHTEARATAINTSAEAQQ